MMYNNNYMISTWFWAILILIIIAAFVAIDANKRGHNGILWAFVVVFMPMMGIFFYLIFISISPINNIEPRIENQYNRNMNTVYNNARPQSYIPPVQTTGKYCVACGKQNIEYAEFCNFCGSKIPSN